MCSVHSFQKRPWQFFFFFKVIKTYYMFALPFHDRIGLLLIWDSSELCLRCEVGPLAGPRQLPLLGLEASRDLVLHQESTIWWRTQNYCFITTTPFGINFTRMHIHIFEVAFKRVTLRAQFLGDLLCLICQQYQVFHIMNMPNFQIWGKTLSSMIFVPNSCVRLNSRTLDLIWNIK